MMWMVFARAPVPDAAYWSGRRWLAALDSVAWPAIVAGLILRLPIDTGLVGRFGVAVCALNALLRLHTALWMNHRYRFTTSRVARVLLVLLVVGLALKAGLAWR